MGRTVWGWLVDASTSTGTATAPPHGRPKRRPPGLLADQLTVLSHEQRGLLVRFLYFSSVVPRATKSRRARGVSAPCVTFYRLPAGNRPRAVLEHGVELSEAEVLMGAFCRRVPRSDTAQEVLIVLCRWRMLIINSYTPSISSIPGCVCPCRLSPAPQNGCSRTPQAVGDSAMEQLEVQLTPRLPAIRRHLARRRRRRG